MNSAWRQILDLEIAIEMLLMSATFSLLTETKIGIHPYLCGALDFIHYLLQTSNICTFKKYFFL